MSRAVYLRSAAEAEAQGNTALAQMFREMAGEGAQAPAEPPAPLPSLVGGAPGPMAGEFYIEGAEAARQTRERMLPQAEFTLPEIETEAQAAQRRIEAPVTAAGRRSSDAGLFRESRILPGTALVVDEETGRAREASSLELLGESFRRQTTLEATSPEDRARIEAQRKAAEESPLLAATQEFQPGRIVETGFMSTLRSIGFTEAGAGNFIFDTLPLYYEVDEQGELQNPDSLADQFARTVEQGIERVAPGYAGQPFLLPQGEGAPSAGIGALLQFVPRPFQAIDRDSATGIDQSGERAAEYTGRFLADVALSAARGRGFVDEFRSIPAVDAVAGESFGGTDLAALVVGAGVPATPLGVASIGRGVTRAAGRALDVADEVDAAFEVAAKAASPAEWGRAVRLQSAANDLLVSAGQEPVKWSDALTRSAEVKKRAADTLAAEIATPYAVQDLLQQLEPTIEQAQALAGASRSGAHILRRAGLDTADPGFLTMQQRGALEQAVADWRLGAEVPTLERAAFAGGELNRELATQPARFVREVLLDGAGPEAAARLAGSPYAPILRSAENAARRTRGGLTPDMARDFLTRMKRVADSAGSIPLATRNPFLRTAFSFADETIAGGSQTLAKRLGRSYRNPLAAEFRLAPRILKRTRTELERAGAYRAALARAISTGAEDVLGNLAPDDMVMVSDRLMLDRRLWSPDKAAGIRAAVAEVMGDAPGAVNMAAVREALSASSGVQRRLPVALDLQARLQPGRGVMALNPGEYRWVADTLAESRWRSLTGARPAVFQGRQLDLAQRPGIEVAEGRFEARRTISDRMRQVADAVLAADTVLERVAAGVRTTTTLDLPAAFERARRTTLGKGLTDWYRSFQYTTTPAPLSKMMSELHDEVPLISRAFAREVSELRKQAAAGGDSNPGGAAINQAIVRRFVREGDDAVAQLDALAANVGAIPTAALARLGISPEREATQAMRYAYAMYQSGAAGNNVAFGRVLGLVARMDEAAQEAFIATARQSARVSAYQQQWDRLMESFFIGTLKGRIIDPASKTLSEDIARNLGAAIRDPNSRAALRQLQEAQAAQATPDEVLALFIDAMKGGVRPPTVDNFNVVVADLRKMVSALEERGAAKFTGKGFADASAETLVSWAMNADKGALIRDKLRAVMRSHPELVVDLVPNPNWQADTLARLGEVRLDALRRVVERLTAISGRTDIQAEAAERIAAPSLVADVYGVRGVAAQRDVPLVAEVDRYINLRLRNLNQTERMEILESTFTRMLSEGTLYPNMTTFRAMQMTGTSGNRATLVEAVLGGLGRVWDQPAPGDPAGRAVWQLVKDASTGGDRNDVAALLADVVDDAITEAVALPMAEQLRNTMRGYGFSTARAISKDDNDFILAQFLGAEINADGVLAVGRDFAEALQKLEVQAASGQLIAKLEDYQTRNLIAAQKAGDLAMYLLLEGLAFSKQMASQGLLAAGAALQTVVPLPLIPNGRYLGVNLLTAPLIMLSTLGGARTGAALAEVPRTLIDMVTPRPAGMVLFEDVAGRQWTKEMLEDAYQRANIYTTAADVDASASFMLDLFREARVMASTELRRADWVSQALAEMDPRRTGLWMRFAIETDLMFRKATFASALRDGMAEAQAAALARASVLDYGDIPDAIRQSVNRYILFASFQMASTKEMLGALARDPETFLRVARLQYRQQQQAGAWAYGEDSARMRVFAVPAGTYDMVPAYLAGPQNPMLKAYGDLLGLVGFASEVAASVLPGMGEPVDLTGRLVEGVLEQQIQPLLQVGVAAATTGGAGAIGRLVPDDWVSALRSNPAMWTVVRDYCDIEQVPMAPADKERRRAGAPTFAGGAQYQFTSREGYRRFQLLQFAATQLRLARTSTDVARTLAAGGVWEEGGDPKYRAAANPVFYYIGLTTPLRSQRPEDIRQRALEQAQREIR